MELKLLLKKISPHSLQPCANDAFLVDVTVFNLHAQKDTFVCFIGSVLIFNVLGRYATV